LEAQGEPAAISVCHCLECQKRTGSAFGAQVRYPTEQLRFWGEPQKFIRTGDTGASVTFSFCSNCATTLFWNPEKLPGQTTVALGAFADPSFVEKLSYSVFNTRRHTWVKKLASAEDYD
jgi:hypothetical protein